MLKCTVGQVAYRGDSELAWGMQSDSVRGGLCSCATLLEGASSPIDFLHLPHFRMSPHSRVICDMLRSQSNLTRELRRGRENSFACAPFASSDGSPQMVSRKLCVGLPVSRPSGPAPRTVHLGKQTTHMQFAIFLIGMFMEHGAWWDLRLAVLAIRVAPCFCCRI